MKGNGSSATWKPGDNLYRRGEKPRGNPRLTARPDQSYKGIVRRNFRISQSDG